MYVNILLPLLGNMKELKQSFQRAFLVEHCKIVMEAEENPLNIHIA